jgi:hypothetical protein
MLATIRKISNEHLRTHEVAEIAKRQMEIFVQEFSDHIPSLEEEERYTDLVHWLIRVMIIKMYLLVFS